MKYQSSLFVPEEIFDKIIAIPILISHIEDKVTWEITLNGEFYVKSTTCTNNTQIPPHPRAKLLSTV